MANELPSTVYSVLELRTSSPLSEPIELSEPTRGPFKEDEVLLFRSGADSVLIERGKFHTYYKKTHDSALIGNEGLGVPSIPVRHLIYTRKED